MEKTRLIAPYIKYEEVEEDLKEIFATGIFSSGTYGELFKKELSNSLKVNYAHLTTSATTALWISLKMFGINNSDEVIVSDFSFPATANVVEDLGAKPVFADVSLDTFNMNPKELERLISSKTKAVIFVNALGNPSGIKEIFDICKSYKIPLIEDAACAIGSKIEGYNCGTFSDISCISFHPRKLICTGEGGAIITNNETWSKWLEVKLKHGASSRTDYGLIFSDFGYNFRLSEIQSLLGYVQLKKLKQIISERNKIRDTYIKYLYPLGFVPQKIEKGALFNCQSIVFKIPKGINRNKLINFLKTQGIESTLGTYSMSSNSYFLDKYKVICKNSNFLEKNTITFPCFNGVNLIPIINTISDFMKK
tara:strand:+ start:4681 stop:5775 length:1095 start_codon:yes stop_codon:yes gene_type:complete